MELKYVIYTYLNVLKGPCRQRAPLFFALLAPTSKLLLNNIIQDVEGLTLHRRLANSWDYAEI
ncbi:unnamed protein product [Tenebrio molitor]|nr:unnamed protein product [Tenebrio molitor]